MAEDEASRRARLLERVIRLGAFIPTGYTDSDGTSYATGAIAVPIAIQERVPTSKRLAWASRHNLLRNTVRYASLSDAEYARLDAELRALGREVWDTYEPTVRGYREPPPPWVRRDDALPDWLESDMAEGLLLALRSALDDGSLARPTERVASSELPPVASAAETAVRTTDGSPEPAHRPIQEKTDSPVLSRTTMRDLPVLEPGNLPVDVIARLRDRQQNVALDVEFEKYLDGMSLPWYIRRGARILFYGADPEQDFASDSRVPSEAHDEYLTRPLELVNQFRARRET